jgi:hypothetical protein
MPFDDPPLATILYNFPRYGTRDLAYYEKEAKTGFQEEVEKRKQERTENTT